MRAAIYPEDMRHTNPYPMNFQVMFKMDHVVQTQCPITLTVTLDQLAMSDVTSKHWQAFIFDILMQGEATALLHRYPEIAGVNLTH